MKPYWLLSGRHEERPSRRFVERPDGLRRPAIYRTIVPSPELIERGGADGTSILNLRFALFDTWQLIESPPRRPFLERIKRGAFSKSVKENIANIRAVLSHGSDPSLGNTVLGKIDRIEETADGASAHVSLFESVPALLLDGLRAGVYGASFRGAPIKNSIVHSPGRSPWNPDGIEEVTRLEIRLADIGPTPFAAYPGTSAKIDGAALSARADDSLDERPYWLIGREPYWKLNRKENRAHGGFRAQTAGPHRNPPFHIKF